MPHARGQEDCTLPENRQGGNFRKDGIYRISGFVDAYGITFNQFLVNDDKPTLIHTGPIGMYEQVEEKV